MECSRAWKCISLSSSSLEFNTCEVVLKTIPVTWKALYRKFPENRWVFLTHLEVHCETLSSKEPGYSWI